MDYEGILAQLMQPQQGILSDPRSAMLSTLGAGMLAQSGPSRMPVGLGQAIGRAALPAINEYQQAELQQRREKLAQVQMAMQLQKMQREQQLQSMLSQGNMNDPDFLRKYGILANRPEFLSYADKIDTKRENQAGVKALQEQPSVLKGGVLLTSPEGQAQMDIGPPQVEKSMVPGVLTSMRSSPYVGQEAASVQNLINTGQAGLTPQQIMQRVNPIFQRHETFTDRRQAAYERSADRAAQAEENFGRQKELKEYGAQLAAANRQPAPVTVFYEAGPNGNIIAKDARTGRTLSENAFVPSLTSGSNNQAMALRREYNSDPSIKTLNTVEPAIRQAKSYIDTGKFNGTDDQMLLKLYLQMTHPKGDQISNLDMRTLSALPDLPGRVVTAVRGFIAGKQLDPEVRREFWNTIATRGIELDQHRKRKQAEIRSRAGNMPGVNIDAVFGQE